MSNSNYSSNQTSHSLAIVSLVLGILGLAAILPVIGPIGAVVTGIIAQRDIRQSPAQYSGTNLARAGLILGWIGIAFTVLILAVICLALLFFIPVSSVRFPVQ